MTAAYASVILDVDSTVSGIEGIDWLAERRGPEMAAKVAELTDQAMRGVIPLESVYGARLEAIRPTRADIDALAEAYIERIAPDCRDVVTHLKAKGVRVVLVSGGLRQAILPLAEYIRLSPEDVHAVDIQFDANGEYASFDKSELATSTGKPIVVERLNLPRRRLAVGDGSTDVAMRPAVDTFGAFTGFVAREPVVKQADVVVRSFARLATLVLG
jgi:phosphoserine phosphatase